MSRLFFFLFAGLLLSLTGCVSKPVENEKEAHAPPLMIAQNSDGDVTIAWDSELGRVYTIYYQATEGANWRTLRTAIRVQGTGETLTVYDVVNPSRPLRRYRLLPEDI